MNSNSKNHTYEVIDLTESYNFASNRYLCSNIVIELDTTDESFNVSVNSDPNQDEVCPIGVYPQRTIESYHKKRKTRSSSGNSGKKKPVDQSETENRNDRATDKLGECPICCDRLGKNPLASTICGHVYCLKCLEKSLKITKKCPTCRRVLKKSSGYHLLYLPF